MSVLGALADAMADDFDKELNALIRKWAGNCSVMEANPTEVMAYALLRHAERSLAIAAAVRDDISAEALFENALPVIRKQFEVSLGAMRDKYEQYQRAKGAQS